MRKLLWIATLVICNFVGTVRADDLKQLLERLKPASLSEAQLRELAGKDHFEPYVLNPILSPGLETRDEWDAGAIGSVSVIKVGDVFHLYYEAWGKLADDGHKHDYDTLQIGHAVSLDGVHWVKDPANPVLRCGVPGSWAEHGTWDPFVRYEDGKFKLWYGGNKDNKYEWAYATSDNGSQFVDHRPISRLGDVEDIHVTRDPKSGEYRLYYWDRAKASWGDIMDGPPAPSGLFVARSENETDFDFANAQRLSVAGQEWPSKYSHVMPCGDGWIMFFGEAVLRGNLSSTGIATSEDGFSWKKSVFPIVRGHDAEAIEAAPNLWLVYYSLDGYFDWPEADVRLAIYEGRIEDVKPLPEMSRADRAAQSHR